MVALKEDESLSRLIGSTVKVTLKEMLTDEVVLGTPD